jgi:hypothetical protein
MMSQGLILAKIQFLIDIGQTTLNKVQSPWLCSLKISLKKQKCWISIYEIWSKFMITAPKLGL